MLSILPLRSKRRSELKLRRRVNAAPPSNQMPIINTQIRNLAERALQLSNNDVARAVRILSTMTGLSFELAFEAIEAVASVIPTQTAE
jgi:hypothetical protein